MSDVNRLGVKFGAQIDELARVINARFDKLESSVAALATSVAELKTSVASIAKRIDRVDEKVDVFIEEILELKRRARKDAA